MGRARPFRVANAFNQFPHFFRRWRKLHHDIRNDKTDERAHGANAFRRYPQEPIFGSVGFRTKEFKVNNATSRQLMTCNHTGDCPFFVHLHVEDAHDDHTEERGSCKSKSKFEGGSHVVRRIHTEMFGQNHCSAGS